MTHMTDIQRGLLDRIARNLRALPEARTEALFDMMEANMYPETYTVKEAAEILKIAAYEVRKYCREGSIKAYKMGRNYRISRVELANFFRDNGGGELFTEDK